MIRKILIAGAAGALLSVTALGAAGPAQGAAYIGAGFAIPDDDNTGVFSTINVTQSGVVNGAYLGLLGFQHTWIGDLSGTLTHAGITVNWMEQSQPLNSNNLNGNYTLHDGAGSTLINAPGPNIATGMYAPDNPFSAFDGTSWAGDWTLGIADHSFLDTGELGSWALNLPDPGGGGPIPDDDPSGISSTITVATGGRVDDLDMSVFGLTHTWMGDLIGTLTHDGVTVTWLQTNPLNSDNLDGDYVFSDAGAVTLGDAVGNPRASGLYAPFSPFSAFHGLAADGDWTLKIVDDAFLDTGAFDHWSLNVSTFAGAPEPGTWGLMIVGFGLTGVGMRRRAARAA